MRDLFREVWGGRGYSNWRGTWGKRRLLGCVIDCYECVLVDQNDSQEREIWRRAQYEDKGMLTFHLFHL